MKPPFDPARRGYGFTYREREINHCPGCGRTHWLIGRTTAECAFCATALPLATEAQPKAIFISRGKPIVKDDSNDQ